MRRNSRQLAKTSYFTYPYIVACGLKNFRDFKSKLKREQLFGEMSPEELNKLITTDRYFQFERDIVEDGLHFIVCDQGVYDALMTLPGAKRKIVLLSYFGEMNDREIGDALGTGRANVQYHRSRALAMMRKTLEQESEEY